MVRFFIIPKIGAGTPLDPFRPKYLTENSIGYSALDLGIEPTFLVGADVSDAQLGILAAQSDVLVIPPLESVVGGNPTLNQVRNRIEQRGIPGSWIVASTTYRAIVSVVGDTCRIAQRLHGRHRKRLYDPGVTLDSALSPAMLADFQSIADSFGISAAALSLTTTVREALLLLGNQLEAFTLAGEPF